MIRSTCLAALAVLVATSLVGCSDTGSSTPSGSSGGGDGETLVIGFSNGSLGHPWRVAIQQAMEAEVARHPGFRMVATNADGNPSKQISDVEDLLARGVDLLMVCPDRSDAFRPAVNAVKAAGIPLVPVDRNISTDDFTCYVGQDNKAIGARVADYIAAELEKRTGKPEGRVIELQGKAGNEPAERRREGFHERVAEKWPGLEIVASQNTEWSRESGMRTLENMLPAHSVIHAIYTHEDEIALGAIEALRNAGRLGEGIIITGNGGSGAALDSIRRGEMTACATYSPVDAGTIGARASVHILQGKEVPRVVRLEGAIVDLSNLDQFSRPDMKPTDYVHTVDLESSELPTP